MNWAVPAPFLNAAQNVAVRLSTAAHRVVAGGPFSGKTQVLLHRARHLSDTLQLAPGQLRIWTASAASRDFLRFVAPLFKLCPDDIQSYDAWCAWTHQHAIAPLLPPHPLRDGPDHALVRVLARYAVRWGFALQRAREYLLVDDADTFTSADLAFILTLAAHVTLFARIDSPAITPHERWRPVCAAAGLEKPDIILTPSYQHNAALHNLAALLQHDSSPSSKSYLSDSAAPASVYETPSYFPVNDAAIEMSQLAEVIRQRNERIGILVPDLATASEVARLLKERFLTPEMPDRLDYPAPDFESANPKIYLFEDARGLNFDTIILPLLNHIAYRGYLPSEIVDLITRSSTSATRWLYLSGATPPLTPMLNTLTVSKAPISDPTPETLVESSPIDDLL